MAARDFQSFDDVVMVGKLVMMARGGTFSIQMSLKLVTVQNRTVARLLNVICWLNF
jgi:hypothetical protein